MLSWLQSLLPNFILAYVVSPLYSIAVCCCYLFSFRVFSDKNHRLITILNKCLSLTYNKCRTKSEISDRVNASVNCTMSGVNQYRHDRKNTRVNTRYAESMDGSWRDQVHQTAKHGGTKTECSKFTLGIALKEKRIAQVVEKVSRVRSKFCKNYGLK